MGVHFISVMQGFIVETNDGGLMKGRQFSSDSALVDGGKVGKKVSRFSDLNLVELLDHIGGPCGNLSALVSGKIEDNVRDRDSIMRTCVIFGF